MSPDSAHTLIQILQKQNMTLTEAFEQFDGESMQICLAEALELQGINHPLFKLAREEGRQKAHQRCLEEQCYELWLAGWKTEGGGPDSWQWYWRRPPKGNRPKGKLFRSTNQAWNALKKESTS